MAALDWYDSLDGEQQRTLRELLVAVSAVDGRPEVDTELPREFTGGVHAFVTVAGEVAGYLHLDEHGDTAGHGVAELLVRPRLRGTGIGAQLVTGLLGRCQEADDSLRVWSHGDHPAARALAERFGFRAARRLHRMRMPLGEPLDVRLPDGVTLRPFRPGVDEDAFLAVNARAFHHHPEQGSLSRGDLLADEAAGWFDPAGFLLAERDGELVGFHWTKIHQRAAGDTSGRPMGEVYVLGVNPGAQGGGLGKGLATAGLEYLRAAGLEQVMLYVEADNTGAVGLYDALGFEIWDTDIQYAR